jgi:hypothetical protein
MAKKKRSKKGCGCPKGTVKKHVKKHGTRCVEILKSGRWKFRKNNCHR